MYPTLPSPSGGHGTVTLNCTDNAVDCLPRCPGGNCVDYAAPPPPLPPLPRAPVAVDHRLPVRLLLTVSILSAFLFLSLALATLLLYRRRRVLRRRRRSATAPLPHGEGFGDDDGDEEAGGGGGGGGEVHHVWYIRTVGLDEATIASIAAVEYRGVGSGGDCAVCLGEFNDGELVRLLPRCTHPFHAPCIDTWLRAHVSCPICRSPVVVPSNVLAAATTDAETEDAAAEEGQVFDEMSPSESLAEDSDASSDTQSEGTEAVAEENGSATPKPIRRSASMDSPLFLVPVPEVQDAAVQSSRKLPIGLKILRVKDKEAAGTSSSSCQTGKFGIGRSMSSSGRAFFFSRNVRSTGTVLPL
uniref:Uncharacterized protein n=1 Tax=Avena sativa TaxID=4498 RepID=A0ACD5XVE7_AVESA